MYHQSGNAKCFVCHHELVCIFISFIGVGYGNQAARIMTFNIIFICYSFCICMAYVHVNIVVDYHAINFILYTVNT